VQVTAEEQQVERAVAGALDHRGCRLVTHWGGTLLQPDDLPFRVDAMPRNYGGAARALPAPRVVPAPPPPPRRKEVP